MKTMNTSIDIVFPDHKPALKIFINYFTIQNLYFGTRLGNTYQQPAPIYWLLSFIDLLIRLIRHSSCVISLDSHIAVSRLCELLHGILHAYLIIQFLNDWQLPFQFLCLSSFQFTLMLLISPLLGLPRCWCSAILCPPRSPLPLVVDFVLWWQIAEWWRSPV